MIEIREINSNSISEVQTVAANMKKTLVDVMGVEKGGHYYSKDWLIDRVKYHVDLGESARIFLATSHREEIIGQAIVRIEQNDEKQLFGYFSTIYVDPSFRSKGVATKLIETVLTWCTQNNLDIIEYNTALDNERLIKLMENFGFKEVLKTNEMVKLRKVATG